jgi:hypothetical protein
MFPMLVLMIPTAIFEWEKEIMLALWPILSISWLVFAYFLYTKAEQENIKASLERTKNQEYLASLKRAGYSIYPVKDMRLEETADEPVNNKRVVCPKCEKVLPEDSRFCRYCGTELIETNVKVEAVKFAAEKQDDLPGKRKSLSTVIVLGILALLIVVAVVWGMGKTAENSKRPATVYNVAVRTISLPDRAIAESFVATWKSGTATENKLIALMDEYGASQGGGKLYVIQRGEFVEEIDSWCFSVNRKVGDCAIIENAYGYSICYISGFNEGDKGLLNNPNKVPDYDALGVTENQYTLASTIADEPVYYCTYIAELEKMISNASYGLDLKKEKAVEYLNELPLDYGQRIILFRIQFPTDTTYCSDIVTYLNERDDISYDQEVFILEELGFAVFADGTVKW